MRRDEEFRGRSAADEGIDMGDTFSFFQKADEYARAGGFHEDQVRAQRREFVRRQAEEQAGGISGFSAKCVEFAERLDTEIVARALVIKHAIDTGQPVPSSVLRFSYAFQPKNPLFKKGALRDIRKTVKDFLAPAPTEPPADLFAKLQNSLGMMRIQAVLNEYSQRHNTRLSAELGQSTKNLWQFFVSIDLARAPAQLAPTSFGPENRGDQLHGRAAFSAPHASGYGMFTAKENHIGYSGDSDAAAKDSLDDVFDVLTPTVRTEILGLEAAMERAQEERVAAETALQTAERGGVQREINEARIRYGAARSAFDAAEKAYKGRVDEAARPIRSGRERARIQERLSGTSWLHDPKARDTGMNMFDISAMEGITDPFNVRVERTDEGDEHANENRKPGDAHDVAAE